MTRLFELCFNSLLISEEGIFCKNKFSTRLLCIAKQKEWSDPGRGCRNFLLHDPVRALCCRVPVLRAAGRLAKSSLPATTEVRECTRTVLFIQVLWKKKKIREHIMEQVTCCNKLTYFSRENSDAHITMSHDFLFFEKLSNNYHFVPSLRFSCDEKW